MSLLAISIIIVSAVMHATWNYLAKRSQGGFAFVWLYILMSSIIYAPIVVVVFLIQPFSFGWMHLFMIIASAIIHLIYSLILQKGYQKGDLSLVYPIARGTGPLIVAVMALFLFDEQLTWIGVTGISLIILGVFVITGGLHIFKKGDTSTSVYYGLIIGVAIASYTLLDKSAVSVFAVSPLLLNYGGIVTQVLMLTPFARRNWKEVRASWKHHRKEAIGVGFLFPLAYLLILMTMTFTPVSYVAPVREVSILIGAIMGAYLPKEGFGPRRIVAAVMMIIGISCVAIS